VKLFCDATVGSPSPCELCSKYYCLVIDVVEAAMHGQRTIAYIFGKATRCSSDFSPLRSLDPGVHAGRRVGLPPTESAHGRRCEGAAWAPAVLVERQDA
jgi:hypothetical protein